MKILRILIICILSFPFTTHAVWWSPNTWSKKEEVKCVERIIERPVIVEKVVEKTVDRIVNRPVEKIVVKTVTVDNPILLQQIDDLKKEIEKLKTKKAEESKKVEEVVSIPLPVSSESDTPRREFPTYQSSAGTTHIKPHDNAARTASP